MRLPLIRILRRHRTFLGALSATLLSAGFVHAQATVPLAKSPTPKATVALSTPVQSPAAKATPAAAATQQPARPAQPVSKAAANPLAKPNPVITPRRIYIDINHATLKELKNIPGIGDVYGKKIIAGRPYANKSQLVSRKVIDASLYETIEGMIVAKK